MARGLTWILWLAAILAGAVVAVPYLPVSRFVPALEELASEKLDQPVSIGEVQVQLVPTARLIARNVHVGAGSQLVLGELEVIVDMRSFASGPPTLRMIRAEGVELRTAVLPLPRRRVRDGDGQGAPVVVRRVVLLGVQLHHPTLKVPPFDADVRLDASSRMETARLVSRDGTLRMVVKPAGEEALAIALDARRWTLPAGAPLHFDTLALQGTLKGKRLAVERMDGELYGGRMSGTARVEWDRQVQISGWTQLAGVDIVPLQKVLGKPAKLSGRLNGDATYSAQGRRAGELREALLLTGSFELMGGAYQGVDLAKAGDLGVKRVDGDATSFAELRGTLQLRGRQVTLNDLCVRSPHVVAGGIVMIAPDQTLTGRLDVSLPKTGGIVGVPVSLGGTTAQPSMSPTKGYLIGAAIGTVLLPGIGTTIGSSIGARIEPVAGCR
jgi:uncharacterized protein involved in outer membrane biogenesis